MIVIGSGVAGSTTALCLAAQKLKVLLLESKQHPRFAIGESTVPSTSAGYAVEFFFRYKFSADVSSLTDVFFIVFLPSKRFSINFYFINHSFKLMGERFGVPELIDLTTYITSKERGLISYPKSHFYFAWHKEKEKLQKQHGKRLECACS